MEMPASNAATSDTAFLAQLLRMSPGTAKVTCKLAAELHTRFPDTRTALAAGDIAVEQARAVVETVTGLPKDAGAEDSAWAEGFLLAQAKVVDSAVWRKFGKHIAYAIDPDGSLDHDEAAKRRRELSIKDNHNGSQTIRWTETDENVATIKAAIHALAAPMPAEDGAQDPRPAGVRRADALLEVCRMALRSGTLPRQRGERPHVHLTVRAQDLKAGTGFGTAQSGEDLTVAVIRRLSCDATLTALALDSTTGVPLQVGRGSTSLTGRRRCGSPSRNWLMGARVHPRLRPFVTRSKLRPMADETRPEFLLVHGAWHGGWCWADLQAALAERGFASRTVDLPSAGGIAELRDDAAVVRAALAQHPVPTVLVGHSYGGVVISEAGADVSHVQHLVYLCAFMLPTGMSVLDAVEHEIPPWIEVDLDTGMATVPDPRTSFYLDCAGDAATAAATRLQPQCMGAFATEQSVAAWQQIPSTYLICTQDNAIPASAQEAMAAGAQTIVRMDASHSPFMSRPGAVADVLVGAAGR